MKRFLASEWGTACAGFIVVLLYAVALDSVVVAEYGWETLRRWWPDDIAWKMLLAGWLLLSLPTTAVAVGLLRRCRVR